MKLSVRCCLDEKEIAEIIAKEKRIYESAGLEIEEMEIIEICPGDTNVRCVIRDKKPVKQILGSKAQNLVMNQN
ncbi:hypothetical protein [Desulforamulus ruminis]|uniref:Uncharacterized protein n=1 Tax=Desulforamulus ruminis (strain ATCC 23193 / DSM 2154 / NCIMB 8452 / DL) TaxID=696281 RepID=F6DSL3_DESRL|nr:hypothetical protein [Desulforamulus ruminis]AEG61103.1 hypothetical protein Desru_2889 [Desulforamulus ruminis DSM 2154]